MEADLAVLLEGSSEPAHDDTSEDTEDEYPVGFDREKFDRGRLFFINNLSQCTSAMTCSLVCGLCVRNLLDVLVETGVTKKPMDSIRRYIMTFVHILKWHYGNVWDLNSSARESIRNVRKMHNNARELMHKKDLSIDNVVGKVVPTLPTTSCIGAMQNTAVPTSRDKVSKKVSHVTQYDMSLVQCGFIGLILMYPRYFGIRCTKYELDDYVYFWRCIGFLLGINNSNNICFGGYERTYNICKKIEQEILLPSYNNPSEEFYPMAKAFTDGINKIMRYGGVSPEYFFAVGLTACGEKIKFKMSLGDKMRFYINRFFVACFLYIPGYRWIMRKGIEMFFRCDRYT